MLLAVAVGADFETVDDLAAAGAAAGAAAAGAAAVAGAEVGASNAGLLLEGFCTPPWPLHAPRPVAMEVVPSLQVVGVPDAAGLHEARAHVQPVEEPRALVSDVEGAAQLHLVALAHPEFQGELTATAKEMHFI